MMNSVSSVNNNRQSFGGLHCIEATPRAIREIAARISKQVPDDAFVGTGKHDTLARIVTGTGITPLDARITKIVEQVIDVQPAKSNGREYSHRIYGGIYGDKDIKDGKVSMLIPSAQGTPSSVETYNANSGKFMDWRFAGL